MNKLNDIRTKQDIKSLVDNFYSRVNQDELLAPVFNEIAEVNWNTHLPVMYNFWSSLLLGSRTYRGNPFPKHAVLPLKESHFQRWLKLFKQAVDENFKGSNAEEAKNRAFIIAQTFQFKMGLMRYEC